MDDRVASGSPYEQTVGFSRAVRTGRHVYVSGTAPIWPDGHVDPDPLTQARRCWEIALDALARLGGSPADTVRTRTYLTDRAYEAPASQAHGEVFADVRRRPRCSWSSACWTPDGWSRWSSTPYSPRTPVSVSGLTRADR